MRKIIDNRKYDTETARKLAEVSHGAQSDFKHYEETLYVKRTGEHFLYGYGHAASKYAEYVDGGGWGAGERIIPLTYAEAREWAERELDADEYEEIFGEVPEGDDGSVTVSLRIKASTRELLRRMASESGRAQGEILDEIVSRASRDENQEENQAI
jgi:hypothetical protein|nr:MAG TPA: putative endoribonuclease [Caudoviricetes sp.]